MICTEEQLPAALTSTRNFPPQPGTHVFLTAHHIGPEKYCLESRLMNRRSISHHQDKIYSLYVRSPTAKLEQAAKRIWQSAVGLTLRMTRTFDR